MHCRLGYTIIKGWRVKATAPLEAGSVILSIPDDPYTDIVLSACCTANQAPNAHVIDHGHTLAALRPIRVGEELVTHSGVPQAALKSTGLVRLIASSSLARAMQMDIFVSDEEDGREQMGNIVKRQRTEGIAEEIGQHFAHPHAPGTPGSPQPQQHSALHTPTQPPPSAPNSSKRNSSRKMNSPGSNGHINGSGEANGCRDSESEERKREEGVQADECTPGENAEGKTAQQAGAALPPKAQSQRAATHTPPQPDSTSQPPYTAHNTNTAAPQTTAPQPHTAQTAAPQTTAPTQPCMPPELLPPIWDYLTRDEYSKAALQVQQSAMNAESDEEMDRGRRGFKGKRKSPGKRKGGSSSRGNQGWRPYVCQCKPEEGKMCREEDGCFNRCSLVECTPGECAAGELCQNQRVQRLQTPYLMLRHVGEEKGWGVLAGEPVKAGSVIIQYTGEVVTKEVADKRQQQYEALGIVHFYLMSLSNELVLDATRAGSMGRFINHSAQPNCITEKWLVGGKEVVVIVAKRDIQVAEELCYDYNSNRIWFSDLT